jgi:transposase
MLSLPASVRIFLCTRATDMRRGFDTLAASVREQFGENPLSGHLFVFRNRPADRLKILYWDRDGFALWYKRLEKGTFRFPAADGKAVGVEVTTADLLMLLEGVDPDRAARQARYRPPTAAAG